MSEIDNDKDVKKMILLQQLKNNISEFLNELISSFQNESNLVKMRLFVDNIPHDLLMEGCIKFIYPWKEMISKKDETFFLEKDDIFSKFDKSDVNHFKELWLSEEMTPDDKKVIWSWFKRIVSKVEKYVKLITPEEDK